MLQQFFKGKQLYIITMAMRKIKIDQQSVIQRSKLRSNKKTINQTSTIKDCPSNQKDSDIIKTQIDHIYNNNASISTYPVFEDTKLLQQPLPQKECTSEKDQKAVSSNNNQSQSEEMFINYNNSEISLEQQQNSLQNELHSKSFINQNKQLNLSTPNSKPYLKYKTFIDKSPYHSEKVSYRKKKRSSITSVPFRRCHDQFEGKIVSLINKLFYDKINVKDIDHLCEKIQKISNKDIFNPYVTSGIQAILGILELKGSTHVSSVNKLKNQIKNLTNKILEELGKIQQYQQVQIQEKPIDIDEIRPKMIKKIYKLLIQSRNEDPRIAREKSLKMCQSFLDKNKSIKEADIICFFRQHQFFTP